MKNNIEDTKFFVWYDSDRRHDEPMYGPYMIYDEKLIESKYYHSLDDLLKINISDSLKKRLISAKVGTSIKISYLHSAGNLMVKCISKEDVLKLNNLIDLDNEYYKIENELSEINKKRKIIIKELNIK